jgi:hypothetical protein
VCACRPGLAGGAHQPQVVHVQPGQPGHARGAGPRRLLPRRRGQDEARGEQRIGQEGLFVLSLFLARARTHMSP